MRDHQLFILAIVTIVISAVIANFLIDKGTAFLGGEFLFSFDYFGHLGNLFWNYSANPKEFFYQTQCRECPIFYQLSSWYAFWSLAARGVGQLLGFHHIVFYLFATVIIQLSFLYLFVKLIFRKFYKFPFIIASLVFIFFPHKIFLIPSATWDGIIYGLIIGVIALVIYIFREIASLNLKQCLIYSVALGILVSFFLNLAISHFPIIFYFLVGVNLWFLPKIVKSKNLEKLLIVNIFTIVIAVFVNLPIVISQFFSGNVHILTDFITLNWLNALTAGATFAKVNLPLVVIFFIGVFVLLFFAKINLKQKVLLILIYFSIVWLLLGLPIGNFKLYQLIFSYIPFMEHIRGLYRFAFFQLLILFVVVYLGLVGLANTRKLFLKATAFVTSIFLLFWLSFFSFLNLGILTAVKIPEDYFNAKEYLDSTSDKKIYFPTYGQLGDETMSGNYSWFSQKVSNSTLYSNPFTSLFYLPNLVFTEGYQLDDPQEGQLRSLINYDNSPEDTLNFLEYLGINYLILDRNYLWSKNFPDFQIDQLTKNLSLDKQFGQIDVYKVDDKSRECKPSYGDFMIGYCYDRNNPEFLINKAPRDYFLDKLVLENSRYLLSRNDKVRIPNLIVSPSIRSKIIEQKILIPFTVYQADNNVKDIFIKKLGAGDYKLYFPILKLSEADRLFKSTVVEIKIDGKVIKTISPYAAYHGIWWEEINIETTKPSNLSIGTKGRGVVVFGNPLLVEELQFKEIEKEVSNSSNLPIISTYGSQNDDLRVQINGGKIKTTEKYFSSAEVNLLSESFTHDPRFSEKFQRYENFQDTNQAFTTKNNSTTLTYSVNYNQRIDKLEFIVGSAFLDSKELGVLKILDSNNRQIFKSSIFQKDKYLVTIPVTQEFINRIGNHFKVQLEVDKPGVLLYRFVVKAKFAD